MKTEVEIINNLREDFEKETSLSWVKQNSHYCDWLESRLSVVMGLNEQLRAFTEYCDKTHGLFIPSWMIDGYNKSR